MKIINNQNNCRDSMLNQNNKFINQMDLLINDTTKESKDSKKQQQKQTIDSQSIIKNKINVSESLKRKLLLKIESIKKLDVQTEQTDERPKNKLILSEEIKSEAEVYDKSISLKKDQDENEKNSMCCRLI